MYNTDLPNRDDLPGGKRLMLSALLAVVAATVLLVTVVLPAEYGIDPTGIGRVLGLTQMGEIKATLAREAEQDQKSNLQTSPTIQTAPSAATPQQSQATPTAIGSAAHRDEMTVTLKPGEAVEIKLEMKAGAKVRYEWTSAGGTVNYDMHADSPQINYHGYKKGQQTERDSGELVAAFEGKHGWFWRNRGTDEITVTLRTDGEYASIKRAS